MQCCTLTDSGTYADTDSELLDAFSCIQLANLCTDSVNALSQILFRYR